MSEKLTVAEALARAEMIDRSLDAWQGTAPQGIAEMGGRDALADRCEMACFGPVPRLDHDEWQRLRGSIRSRSWDSGSGGLLKITRPPPCLNPVCLRGWARPPLTWRYP